MTHFALRLSPLALAALAFASFACDDGDGGRVIQLTQTDDNCTPNPIDLKAGENVTFEVKNTGSKDKELEGIDGTQLEELLVPSGRTRSIDYTAPGSAGTQKIKCYVPGGSSTIIELKVSGAATGDGGAGKVEDHSRKTDKAPTDTVAVGLAEYKVSADKGSVAAGPIKFIATNTSKTEVHELAVLRTKDDGSFENTGEIENIDPGKNGSITLDLPKGKYVLACLIVPGEAGSKVDHFQQGMRLDFEVK